MSETKLFTCDICGERTETGKSNDWLFLTVSQLGSDGEKYGYAEMHICVLCGVKPEAPVKLWRNYFDKKKAKR